MRRDSLVRRLIQLAALWILAALILTGVALTTLFQQSALRRFDAGLNEMVEALFAGTNVGPGGAIEPPFLGDSRSERAYSGRYWQVAKVGPDGQLVEPARSRSLFDAELRLPPRVVERLRRDQGATIFYDVQGPAVRDGERERLRAAALMARLPGADAPVVFMAAEDRTPLDTDANRFAVATAAALVLLGAGLVVAVLIQVRVGLQPLFAVRREVARVRRGKAQRVSGDYPEEITPLADELNALLDHNQEVVERQRTHVGNLAHALKTPLSVMLAEAEKHPGELAEVVSRQAHAMRDHVDHHLRRARAAARAQTQGERTEVAPVLEELTLTLERIFHDGGCTIDWDAPDELAFQGERQDLLEIVGNVLENGCKWSNSRVRVRAKPEERPDRFTVVVEDDGPGLPEERRAEVMKRGARLDESAPGSGLGLSIVDELARAYGGEVRLGESSLGGLKVELVLPRAGD
jgi:signal transduction histidine kinase